MGTFAARLTRARVERGLSQVALAKLAGVAPGTIGNLEAGTRGAPRKLLAIAAALDVSPAWLETGKGEMREADALEGLATTSSRERSEMMRDLAKWLPALPARDLLGIYTAVKNAFESTVPQPTPLLIEDQTAQRAVDGESTRR